MNKKRMIALLGVVAMLLLGGCVATPYYGGSVGYSSGGYYGGSGYYGRSGYGYGYRPAIPVVRSNLYFGGHSHGGHRHSYGGHRHSHHGHGHFGGGHRGGHGHGHGGGHRGHRGHH